LVENIIVLGKVPVKPPKSIFEFVTKFVAGFTVFAFVVGICVAVFFPEATAAVEISEKTMMTSLSALLGLLGGKALKP